MTAFVGAEGLINSRPLTYQSSHPADDVPLTPNHFLYGQLGGTFAPDSVDETQFNLKKRWRRVQELIRHFWQRWLREWIPSLNCRKKWNSDKTISNLEVWYKYYQLIHHEANGHFKALRKRLLNQIAKCVL